MAEEMTLGEEGLPKDRLSHCLLRRHQGRHYRGTGEHPADHRRLQLHAAGLPGPGLGGQQRTAARGRADPGRLARLAPRHRHR